MCNKFLAKFEQHNDQITIHDIVTPHKTCLSSDVNAQDNRFLGYLKAVKSFSIHGKVLKLTDTDNHSLIIIRWIK